MSFIKKSLGVAGVSAIIASAFVPGVAFGAPEHDSDQFTDVQAGVKIVKTIEANDDINIDRDTFTFNYEYIGCNGVKQSEKTSCRANGPALSADTGSVTFAQTDIDRKTTAKKDVAFPLPAAAEFPGAGIYVWKVTENSTAPSGNTVVMSQAVYRVKAYVELNDGTQTFKAVTIAQDKNDDGTDVIENNKKEQIDFKNTYKDEQELKVTKTVKDKGGLEPLDKQYTFTVELTYPANYSTPGSITVEGDATDVTPSPMTPAPAEITFKLKKDQTATIKGLPVGTKYTITEKNDGDFTATTRTVKTSDIDGKGGTTDGDSVSTASMTLGNGGNLVTYENTYEPPTPTGIALAAAPYVLMIGLPLLGIGGYIAMRRRVNA